jgi:biopolymer transport protein ExbD
VKNSRRMKRMSRNRQVVTRMNLTSLMDVFTILVFFLLVNSASTEVLETPKQITLPASVVEDKPRETVVIFISPDEVTVQGKAVVATADILAMKGQNVAPIGARLAEVGRSFIGIHTKQASESQEVTILADKSVPFRVVKKVMSTCTSEGYGRISLAVLQKASQTAYREQPPRTL